MSGVKTLTIGPKEAGERLDKWFKDHYPGLTFGRLQKLLRKGDIRLDGKRVKDSKITLAAGQTLRLPPLDQEQKPAKPVAPKPKPAISEADAADLQARVIYKDRQVIVLNKPASLAVQGGSGTTKHLDGMLDALKFGEAERPRLVHRLDKDTSGVMLLARTREAADALTRAFRTKEVRKFYWAVVVGVPKTRDGKIDAPLSKRPGKAGEKMEIDEFDGKRAVTFYRTVETLGNRAAWLQLEPVTGRTHQLRVHLAAIGHPILGDGKYGGQEAFLSGAEMARKLHLHARTIRFPHPKGGRLVTFTAPLPPHMAETWETLGFDSENAPDPFEDA